MLTNDERRPARAAGAADQRGTRTLRVGGLIATVLAVNLILPSAQAQSQQAKTTAAPTTGQGKVKAEPTTYKPDRFAGKARRYYHLVWGIDSPSVKLVESGELVRFAWRVVDSEKAKILSDKSLQPQLIDPRAGVSLIVPTMAKIGQLRQSAPPEAGRTYWMVFSNKGGLVKRGDRVDVVIGQFRAEGLGVD